MNENNQTPGEQQQYEQQPPYTAPQQPYGQQPPYTAPQQPYSQQPPYTAPQQPYSQQPPYTAPQQPYSQRPPYTAPQQPYGQRPPYTAPQQPYYARPLTDNTRVFSVLSNLGPLWLIGLLADRNNPRVSFHVNQGIILFIFECVFGAAARILHAIFNVIFSFGPLDLLASAPMVIINSVGGLLFLVLIIIGIVHAAQDLEEPLPIIGKLFTIVK
jgi:uncharacterized membrane protein